MDVRELHTGETALAFEALRTLRPTWDDEARLVRHVDEVLRPEGYRLVAAFEPDQVPAVAVAGIRLAHMLAWGRYLYVDDLGTTPEARRRGHAGALVDWLIAEARRLDCDSLQLDSGFGPERSDAHRLYLNKGLRLSSHHFSIALKDASRGGR